MTPEERQRKVGRTSFLIAVGIALVLAGVFYGAANLGGYPAVARYGGAAWVFLLSLIIGMPTITPLMKRRIRE